ncbi:hypothetical protein E4T39_05683 [Aureobasidium subglaciale]|nr:hypothetical protein E4T39_05683 [Aureobasidium subglaciale]
MQQPEQDSGTAHDLAYDPEHPQSKMTSNSDTMDIGSTVADMARENVMGHFQATYDLSARFSKVFKGGFRIAFEVMRVLYDQGHYRHLQTMIDRLPSEEWSAKEKQIATMMKYVVLDSVYTEASNDFTGMILVQNVKEALHGVELEAATADDILLSVLLLGLSYPQHKVWKGYNVDEPLAVLGGITLTTLITFLLEREHFWEAEQLLSIFFRKYKTEVKQIEFDCIYSAIEVFLSRVDLEDERRTWAQVAILQTYCEGYIRVTSWASHVKMYEFWQQQNTHLIELISNVRKQYGEETWLSSRSRIRYDLMCLDLEVWSALQYDSSRNFEFSSAKKDTLHALYKLKELARRNQDNRSQASAQWRMEMLAYFTDPHVISGTTDLVSVPRHIYELRHRLLTKQDLDLQRHWLMRSKGITHVLDYWRLNHDYESILENHRSTIVLLGRPGTGRTTLLRTLTGKYAATSGIAPCTPEFREEDCMTRDGSVLRVIDTPGLGEQDENNFEAWTEICETLQKEHKSKQKGSYLVYLIDVSSNEMNEADQKHVGVLKRLVGDGNWNRVSVVFTHGTTGVGDDNGDWRKKVQNDLIEKYTRLIFGETKDSDADIVLLNLDYTDKEMLESETKKAPGIDSGESTSGARGTEHARANPPPPSYGHRQDRAITPPPSYDHQQNSTVTKLLPTHEHQQTSKASAPPPSYESVQSSAVTLPKRHIYRPANLDQVDQLISRILGQHDSGPFVCQHEMCVEHRTFKGTTAGRYLKRFKAWEPSYASEQTSVYTF